jgi:hypothetical protein
VCGRGAEAGRRGSAAAAAVRADGGEPQEGEALMGGARYCLIEGTGLRVGLAAIAVVVVYVWVVSQNLYHLMASVLS